MSNDRQEQLNASDTSLNSPRTDVLATSLPARVTPYRSLSAKRPRDPSHRKSVSFNDVPIVHEVPLHDAMRNANSSAFRSWTYTDATTATPSIPSYGTTQIVSPFTSSSSLSTSSVTPANTTTTTSIAQKLHANRLSSTLYSSLATNTTGSRIPDWAMRPKSVRVNASILINSSSNGSTITTSTNIDESTTTNHEQNQSHWAAPSIVVHTPEEKVNKEISGKPTLYSAYNNPYFNHCQTASTQTSANTSSINNTENGEEKKHPYRTALIPDTEHQRTLPFTYEHVSDSAATYTTMLSTQLSTPIQPVSNEQSTTNTSYVRTARIRSATLPISVNNSGTRNTDSVSITPLRATPSSLSITGAAGTSRAVLRPTTIAFQYTQPGTTNNSSLNGTAMLTSTTTNTNSSTNVSSTINGTSMATSTNSSSPAMNNPSLLLSTSSPSKPPIAPQRFTSAAVSTSTNHSRFGISSGRPFPNSSLVTSNIRYTFAHPNSESTLINTTMPQSTSTVTKAAPTAYPRSRSATVLSSRRHAASMSNQNNENHSNSQTTNSGTIPGTPLYGTNKRNPNVRQNYGSYYMHRVLLPTTIN